MSDDLAIGQVQWHCSEEDGGPDVGVLLRLTEDAYLWCGEITREEAQRFNANEGRWHLVLHRGGKRLILGQVVDEYCAREAIDEIASALRARASTEAAG